MKKRHSLLERQINQRFGGEARIPEALRGFVEDVDAAYREFDQDREMLEHSLDLSSNELLQANAELRAVFQAFPDLFMWLDSDGRILAVQGGQNDRLALPDRIIGRCIQNVPIEGLGGRFLGALIAARENREVVDFEYKLPIDGVERNYEARILPLVNGRLLAVIRNITDRTHAEQERNRASRLDSIGLLAGGIAHDFNNLMMVVLANLSIVQMEANGEESQEILEETRLAVLRTRDLTQQLLTFARGGEPIKKTTSMGDLIRESAAFALRGSKATFDLQIDPDLQPVEADQGQMSQVLNNLIINADQAMPSGGTIRIVASNALPDECSMTRSLNRRCVKIAVIDQGVGIAPDQIDRIFDPYYTTKGRGSGLGLTTCHSIIQKHGGCLAVNSKLNQGTTFTIFLPASDSSLTPSRPASRSMRQGHGLILLMDDEEDVLRSSRRMLQALGYEVVCARHGAEAVELFKAQLDVRPFDAVIMDLTIPGGLGGAETIELLRDIDPHVKAIVSSGYSNNPVMANHLHFGFRGVLAKPYDLRRLGAILSGILAKQDDVASD